jgi:hypothetical protein
MWCRLKNFVKTLYMILCCVTLLKNLPVTIILILSFVTLSAIFANKKSVDCMHCGVYRKSVAAVTSMTFCRLFTPTIDELSNKWRLSIFSQLPFQCAAVSSILLPALVTYTPVKGVITKIGGDENHTSLLYPRSVSITCFVNGWNCLRAGYS